MDKLVAFDTIMCYLPEVKDRALGDAVDTIRKEIVEVQKPSHNSAMLEIALCLRDHFECEVFVGRNTLLPRIESIIAQLQQ
jgi:hypothetical protein